MENTQLDFEKDDYRYMKQAITQAKKAYKRQQKSNESRIENEMKSRLQLFDNADENCLLLPLFQIPLLRAAVPRNHHEKHPARS